MKKKQRSSFSSSDGFIRRSPGGNTDSNQSVLGKTKTYKPELGGDQKEGLQRPDGFFARKSRVSQPDGRSLGRNPIRRADIDMTLNDDNTKNGKKPKRFRIKDKKKAIKRTLLSLTVIIVLVLGFLFAKGYLQLRHVFGGGGKCTILECEIDPSQLKGEGDGRVNMVLYGRGGLGHDGADLTDTILIASVDPINKQAGLLSIPRDLYVNVPGYGRMKINAVFYTYKQKALNEGKKLPEAENEGMEATDKMVSDIIGIPIHRHVLVDFKGFEKAINTVGGIDINVKQRVYEKMAIDNKRYYLDVKTGQEHFDGLRALAYSRTRHCLYGCYRGDFDRAQRQREVIVALQQKVLSLGTFSNPLKISGLIDAFGDHVRTNLSIDEIKKLYELSKDIDSNKVKSISLVDPPHDFLTTGMIDGQSIVQPIAGLDNYDAIRTFVRKTFLDGFIRKEDPAIVVLNGSDQPGLAEQKAQELKGYGYRVVKVGNAPNKNYSGNTLIDLDYKDTRYTKRYLELRFGTTATTKLPHGLEKPDNADFVIIVGR